MVENQSEAEMKGPQVSTTDDEEAEEEPVMVAKLDFEKLFRMAEDPDMAELLRGPIDTAIHNLENGKEVQKLTAIRSFADLLDTEGDVCLKKLLPVIQKTLNSEKSNLDLHCEAAVVYKTVIQNEVLTAKLPGIVDVLLDSILQNIQHQKENLNAAAWLETIVEVADLLSLASVKKFIVPVAQQQADPVQRVQRRIIATKLLNKLANILPPQDVRKDLTPCVQMLCKDANSNVRSAIAQRLFVIADSLKSPHDVVVSILPCFVQLLADEDSCVRESAMNNLNDCIPLLTKEAKKHSLFPLVKRSTEESLEKKNETLIIIARNIGRWSHSLTDVLDQLDKSWVLNTYCKMIQIASEKVEPTNLQNARNLLRRACVFNLPCMLFMFSKNSDRLVQFIDQFCTDPDEEVRMCIASSLHEIFALHVEKSVLLSSFFELLRSGSIDVVAKVAFNLDKMLKDLYKTVNEKPGKHSAVQLDRLILGSNNILHNTGSWRSHEALLKSLATLPQCISQRQIVETFIPLLKKETLSVRAIPCRVAAADSLLVLMRHVAADSPRRQVIEFFNEQIAKNKCSYRRIIFIDVVEIVLKKFSKRFFLENFLEQTLVLTTDIISNIRIRALRVLPKIKSRLRFADDNEVLLRIERAVRDLLRLDCNKSTRQILNSAAVELSRCETCERVDKEDEEKKAEEDRLWSLERAEQEEQHEKQRDQERSLRTRQALVFRKKSEEEEDREIRPTGIRRPDVSRASSWRSERRAVAVVRPQLVVMMRSASPSPLTYRSPSPAPKESSSRPSRLPLSTTTREREKLRKTAAESVFSDSRNHRSSSVTSSRGSIMSTSASSAESSANNDSTGGYGLRRSATSTSVFGASSYTSNASYALSHSRSTSNMRRPTYGLTHVSTQSTFERKPSHVSLRIRNVSSVLK